MSKQSERLLVQLSEIRAETIEEADEAVPGRAGKRPAWRRWAAMAAGLAVVLFTAGVLTGVIPLLGGNTSNEGVNPSGSGPTTFMSYAGPVFPLTLREADSAITAERSITLDFTPWMPVWRSNEEEADREGYTPEQRQETLDMYNDRYPEGGRWLSSTDILVTDAYTLTNTTEEEKTVSVLYPFSGALYELAKCTPTLRLDKAELDATLHAGGYSGGFQDAYSSSGERRLNLNQLNSWEEYKALLSDGRYQRLALGEYPDLSGVPVTVYRFFDYYGPEPDEKAGYPNPSIRAGFELDYDRTAVLTYGFHAASYDRENGTMIQGFSIPQPFDPRHGDSYYLIVVGDDIRNLTTGAYVTGGTDADTKKLDNAGVSVERYTSDLETALRMAAELIYGRREQLQESKTDFEMYFGLFKEFLCSYGVLSEEPAERYVTGWLEDLEVDAVDRVFYLEAEVTVPAGGSVQLTAEMRKHGSYDFYCAHTENQGVYGYDLVTELGSNLTCTVQRAAIEDRGVIEIVRQNFGFDLKNGVKTVDLDPMQEHYYLEVSRR